MRSFALCLLAVAAIPASSAAPAVETKAATVCGKCHGPTGDSEKPAVPRLNGQTAEYIAAQLRNFRDHKRDDTHARGFMWGNARTIDDETIAALGQYYARQAPTKPQTGGALAAEGERLYLSGDNAKGLVACQTCHGKAGEGSGFAPRVAGQHAVYFRLVMGAFRSGLRHSDAMTAAAKPLSDRQIEALSSYLTND